MSFNLLETPSLAPPSTSPPPPPPELEKERPQEEAVGYAVDVEPTEVLATSQSVGIPESSKLEAQVEEDDSSAIIQEPEAKEESDSDDEDWDEISKGRYFGAGDDEESGPLCHNCKQSGHKRKDCPHQLCRSCGALDDHDTMRCPMTQRCYNCSRLGHLASKCPEPHRQVGSFCHDCGSRSHLARSCPQIWRLYLPAEKFDVNGDWSVTAWCYNCAGRGHYGDDCPKPHRMRLIEPSAFCQANQPESRTERRDRDAREQREERRHQRFDSDDVQDDWFGRQTGDLRGGSNGSYNSFQHGNNSYGYPPPPPPPPLRAPRGSRHEARFDPYARPSGPIITSEKYPRGLPPKSQSSSRGGASKSTSTSRGGKRKPVPAAQRLSMQGQSKGGNTRGGKAYRGGGRR